MSEYQYVAFRAIDGPVSEKNLEYMHRQSSRAEITPWSFDNEYHYGDFHGDALEMMRRGYDIHLHYANFGIRKLLIRLPYGLPDDKAAEPYLDEDGLQFVKDKQGPGGTLCIDPSDEAGDLEELWEVGAILDRLVPLRAEILDGDLRPLYLASLAVACDGNHDPEEMKEPPVPAGLGELTAAQQALAAFYGLSEAFIAAAAQDSPALATRDDFRDQLAEWLRGQAPAAKDAWLAQLLSDPHATARGEIVAAFRQSRNAQAWPTVQKGRTIAELETAASEVAQVAQRKAAEKAARERAKRLADIVADPKRTLLETESLVKQRTRDAYSQITKLLAEVREALAGTKQSDLADQQAEKLRTKNPTLRLLVAELRKEGFLAK